MKRRIYSALAAPALLCAWCAPVGAQAPVEVPALGDAIPLTLPDVTQSVLPNGLRVVVVEDHRQPAIHLRLVLPAGYAQEPGGKAGLAALLADGLFSSQAEAYVKIRDQIAASGASFHAEPEEDFLTIGVDGISLYSDDFADFIADTVERPAFPAHGTLLQFADIVPTIVGKVVANPASLATAAMDHIVFGASAYGNISIGTPASIASLTRDDFQAFCNANFSPSGAVFFVSGDITGVAARAMALKSFGGWTATAASPGMTARHAAASVPEPVPAAGAKPAIIILDRPGAQQTEIRIGTRTTGFSDPQRVAGDLATAVLGGGEFENRLTQEIRVKRGLTYGVASAFERHRDSGEFLIQTYTKNASTGEVVRLALAEVAKIVANPPAATEIADHKSYLTGSFAVRAASVEGLLGELIESVVYGDGIDALTHYKSQVDAVAAEQVSKIIGALHIESAHIVLVGDAKSIQPQVSDIGTVTVIEPDQLDLTSPTLRRASVTF